MTLNETLEQAFRNLDGATRELVLDFSSVRRIDAGGIGSLEKLAAAADAKSVKVDLQGVDVSVYKVLKLVKLTPRFSFTN